VHRARAQGACVDDEELALFVDGAAEAGLRAAIETHLDGCAACRTLVSELARADPSDPALEATLPGRGEARNLPDSVGRYRVTGPLGMGASGVVLSAYDPELDRALAIKLLRSGVARADEAAEARERLQREARAMARVAHPHVVAVYDVGTFGDQVFVAMELVQGPTLRAALAVGPRQVAATIALFAQAGAGLSAAHQAGLVHRDFKPDNVLVGRDGRVRVTDFGLASVHARSPRAEDEMLDSGVRALNVSLTVSGVALGTPRYMAPEQHAGASVDARADQFAFSVALYEALSGQHPFPARSYGELRASVMAGKLAPSSSFRALPRHVRACLRRGLAVRAEDRYPSMDALLEALQDERAPSSLVQRGSWLFLSLTLLLGCALALRFAWPAALPLERATRAVQRPTSSLSSPPAPRTTEPDVVVLESSAPAPPSRPTVVLKTPRAAKAKATARQQSKAPAVAQEPVRAEPGPAVQAGAPTPEPATKFVGPRLKPNEF
jgi:serine/threonine protein kinase